MHTNLNIHLFFFSCLQSVVNCNPYFSALERREHVFIVKGRQIRYFTCHDLVRPKIIQDEHAIRLIK